MTATGARVREAVAWLKRRGTARNRDGMARYGIVARKVMGVSVSTLQRLARRLGRDHALAVALWETGWYEARMLTAFVDEPERVTKVGQWSRRREEFVKRAAFALLAALALHDKRTGDAPFLRALALVERAAPDERNFVKKGVSWALRVIGRRNPRLHAAAVAVARRLTAAAEPAARWVGRDALRELTSPAVRRRVAARGKAALTNRAR